MPAKRKKAEDAAPEHPRQVMAVIDVGATSVRMVIAQVEPGGAITPLEALQQAVNLGRDTFTQGTIHRETTEICVDVLNSFRKLLAEYGIDDASHVRAVATSAVREALNRDTFLDRVYIGTGLNVEVIDEAEVNRYTYLSVKPLLNLRSELRTKATLLVEVGGGSTEFLVLRRGEVASSHSYRFGSLRMREALEDFRAPAARLPQLLESQIEKSVAQIRHSFSVRTTPNLLVLGGDARFAAAHLTGEPTARALTPIALRDLTAFAQEILPLAVDDLVRRYHLSYPDAECLGPALLTYSRLGQALGVTQVLVAGATLRDGLLAEMAGEPWSDESTRQILRSATELAKRYECDLPHTEHVMKLSRALFAQMASLHQLSPRYELILAVAALLHEVGLFISNRSHHKHSMYIIDNSEIFGLGARDVELVSLVARYHRKAAPKPTHDTYATLDRESRIAVAKLAAILRIADALDKSHDQSVRDIDVAVRRGALVITAGNVSDLTMQQLGLQQKGSMFEDVYGLDVTLRTGVTGGAKRR